MEWTGTTQNVQAAVQHLYTDMKSNESYVQERYYVSSSQQRRHMHNVVAIELVFGITEVPLPTDQ